MKYCTIEADITKMEVDVIVNAANERMLGGGGVDGAIHAAAGPLLLEACKSFPETDERGNVIYTGKGRRVPTGGVRITPAFKLPSKFVIHTAGPIWRDGGRDCGALLASCYMRSLELATLYDARTIAFPAISTGVFGAPPREACEIAVEQVKEFAKYDFTQSGLPHTIEQIFLVIWKAPEVARCFDVLKVPTHRNV